LVACCRSPPASGVTPPDVGVKVLRGPLLSVLRSVVSTAVVRAGVGGVARPGRGVRHAEEPVHRRAVRPQGEPQRGQVHRSPAPCDDQRYAARTARPAVPGGALGQPLPLGRRDRGGLGPQRPEGPAPRGSRGLLALDHEGSEAQPEPPQEGERAGRPAGADVQHAVGLAGRPWSPDAPHLHVGDPSPRTGEQPRLPTDRPQPARGGGGRRPRRLRAPNRARRSCASAAWASSSASLTSPSHWTG
ncbi:hypothetical protein GA0115258_13038, partial [Streptomyces sp. LamerLS-31b]